MGYCPGLVTRILGPSLRVVQALSAVRAEAGGAAGGRGGGGVACVGRGSSQVSAGAQLIPIGRIWSRRAGSWRGQWSQRGEPRNQRERRRERRH